MPVSTHQGNNPGTRECHHHHHHNHHHHHHHSYTSPGKNIYICLPCSTVLEKLSPVICLPSFPPPSSAVLFGYRPTKIINQRKSPLLYYITLPLHNMLPPSFRVFLYDQFLYCRPVSKLPNKLLFIHRFFILLWAVFKPPNTKHQTNTTNTASYCNLS